MGGGGRQLHHEVEAYELVKLRLLNGCHSLIACLGGLDRRPTIPESRGQMFIEQAARAVIAEDYLPTIELSTGFDVDGNVATLFTRWSNTSLGDGTARVGSDGSTKLLQRVTEPAVRSLDNGVLPQHLALTLAAWICCVVPPKGFDPGPVAEQMLDPARPRLAAVTADAVTGRAHVDAVITGGFFPDEPRRPS